MKNIIKFWTLMLIGQSIAIIISLVSNTMTDKNIKFQTIYFGVYTIPVISLIIYNLIKQNKNGK